VMELACALVQATAAAKKAGRDIDKKLREAGLDEQREARGN
jgi:hypothetical protein